MVLEVRSWKGVRERNSRCRQGCVSSRSSKGERFLSFFGAWRLPAFLDCWPLPPTSECLTPTSRFHPYIFFFFFLLRPLASLFLKLSLRYLWHESCHVIIFKVYHSVALIALTMSCTCHTISRTCVTKQKLGTYWAVTPHACPPRRP